MRKGKTNVKKESNKKSPEILEFIKTVKKSQIPVTVLTGFLGSGKTTLLNYILGANHGKKIAVIENEFGEVGVDDQLVNKKIVGTETIIEMSNGCICCTVRKDLIKTLKDLIYKLEKFDYILIETTGLADPAPVAQTFFIDPVIKDLYRLDAIITVVDAKHIEIHLDEVKEDGVENESVEQIAFADKILLNKIDLVTPDDLTRIKSKIRAINSSVQIYETQMSVIDLEKILDIKAFDLDAILKNEPDFLEDEDHQHDNTIGSVGLIFEGELNAFLFTKFINEYIGEEANDLFRYKGVIAFKGEKKKIIFQGIHMIFRQDASTEEWTEGEKRMNRLCFIGRNLDKVFIEEEVKKCIVLDDSLRFKIGERVECQVEPNVWLEGKVICLWDEGNPYRVKLDEDGSEVHAMVDDDKLIKKLKVFEVEK